MTEEIDYNDRAMKTLMAILQAQPNYFQPRLATESHGQELSQFVQGFIKTHTDYLKAQSPSR